MKSFPTLTLRVCGTAALAAAVALVSPGLFASGNIAPEKAGLAAADTAVESHEVYRFDNTEVNRAELKAALERLNAEINHLGSRINTDTATEPALRQRLVALQDRRDALKRDLRKVNRDALVTDVRTEWRELSY